MQLQTLNQLIDANPALAAHKDFLSGLVQPNVEIVLDKAKAQPHESRLGGEPFAPADFSWPEHKIGVYLFIGQINFAELIDPPADLPRAGLLSLFYALDQDDEIFWRDEDYILGFYWPTLEGMTLHKTPHKYSTDPCKISFRNGIDIPRHEDLREDWPFDFEVLGEALEALPQSEQLPLDYLLGSPSFDSLAYDPTPDAPNGNWRSLITLQSHKKLKWCWQDGARLMVFIEKDKLAAQDFGRLLADAG